jgi:hypothetical protein
MPRGRGSLHRAAEDQAREILRYGQRVDSCPVCSHVELTTHRWPEAFSCKCGAVIVLDLWLPDGQERGLIRFLTNL